MMYIAKIAGHTIQPGIELEIQGVAGIDDLKIEVLEVRKNSFRVKWLTGEHAGNEGSIPYSLFADIGQGVEVIGILDDGNPNQSFLAKKLGL